MAPGRKGSAGLVGAFVVGGVLLALLAIAFFGAGRMFERKWRCVCYFPGSVNGLSIGSAVKFRGVPIGSVFDMRVRYRQRPGDFRIPVFIEVGAKRLTELGGPIELPEQALRSLIDRGLRARLETESVVTGALYVDLDLRPETPLRLAEVGRRGAYTEIPALPSEIEELGEMLRGVADGVRKADLPGVMRSVRETVDGVNQLVNGPEVARALGAIPPALSSVSRAADRVGAQVEPLGSSVQGAAEDIRRTVEVLNRTLADTRLLVAPDGAAVVRLENALGSVERAARSVRELADFLQRNPNALVVGKKR